MKIIEKIRAIIVMWQVQEIQGRDTTKKEYEYKGNWFLRIHLPNEIIEINKKDNEPLKKTKVRMSELMYLIMKKYKYTSIKSDERQSEDFKKYIERLKIDNRYKITEELGKIKIELK